MGAGRFFQLAHGGRWIHNVYMTKSKPLPTAIARKVAVQADADPRTVQRVVQGLLVRSRVGERIRRALAAMNLALVLALLVSACSSGDGLSRKATLMAPDAGGGPMGHVSASSPAVPDAGLPDALVLVDTGPADMLAPVAPDTMPAQQPDTRPADALVVVEPDAQPDTRIRPDTKPQPDSRLAPTCRWRHAQSGQTADVYAVDVDPSKACGTVPGNGSLCYVGCMVASVIVSFEIQALSQPGQAITVDTNEMCTARVLTEVSDLSAICFSTAEACAGTCR